MSTDIREENFQRRTYVQGQLTPLKIIFPLISYKFLKKKIIFERGQFCKQNLKLRSILYKLLYIIMVLSF